MAESTDGSMTTPPVPATSSPASVLTGDGSRNPLILGAYGTIVVLWIVTQFVFVPYVIHLLLLVTAILYVACHQSLILRKEYPKEGEEGYDPDNSTNDTRETLRQEDAYHFPLVGSASLFSLYLAFKFLGQDIVNLLIGAYFGIVGCGAVTLSISPLLESVVPPSWNSKPNTFAYRKSWNLPPAIPSWIMDGPIELDISVTLTDVVAFLLSACFVAIYFQSKHWTLNNVLGICFCLQGIERFSLGTYKIGAILLIGLFFYDIFWVFGTDVMVTVAKNLDGPIKILFPRSLVPNEETGKLDLSLLGLGDIVIPGFFLALLLRFDAHVANVSTSKIDIHVNFPKPYFHSALIAYVLGLGTTLFVMVQFNAAQPALLYLVPACLGSSFLCASLKGQVHELLAYSEEEEEEEKKDGEEKKEEEEKKDDKPKPEEAKKED